MFVHLFVCSNVCVCLFSCWCICVSCFVCVWYHGLELPHQTQVETREIQDRDKTEAVRVCIRPRRRASTPGTGRWPAWVGPWSPAARHPARVTAVLQCYSVATPGCGVGVGSSSRGCGQTRDRPCHNSVTAAEQEQCTRVYLPPRAQPHRVQLQLHHPLTLGSKLDWTEHEIGEQMRFEIQKDRRLNKNGLQMKRKSK
jgi:hypothetical protein